MSPRMRMPAFRGSRVNSNTETKVLHLALSSPDFPEALCRHFDPDTWHHLGSSTAAREDTEQAIEVCSRCVHRIECAEFAMEQHIDDGIFGGLTPAQRRQARAAGWTKGAAALALAAALLATPTALGVPASSDAAVALAQAQRVVEVPSDPRAYVRQRASRDKSWTGRQWACLSSLVDRENRAWDVHARNRAGSSAYGLFQILRVPVGTPLPKQWERFARYIEHRYGTPCRAYAHSVETGWY